MMMESTQGSASSLAGFKERKRRSSRLRRPRGSLDCFTYMPPAKQTDIALSSEGNPSLRKTNSKCGSVKVKLKLGGVTRTLQTNSEAKANGVEQKHVQKTLFLEEIHQSREHSSKTMNGASLSEKSKRAPKKRVLDPEPDIDDDDDGDEEIRYLEKLKSKRVKRESHEAKEGEGGRKIQSNGHNVEDKEQFSSEKKPRMGMVDLLPTTRTRALQSGNDLYSVNGSGSLEFPDGLPLVSSKKQKQKLSEVEQQSKKAEAAQRRKIQSEKAAQEAEAEAIRKILGQDSGRKKREEKIKKQQEERAQERAVRSSTLASNTIRLVLGPSGTTMTFSEDIGLPDIFKPVTYSYPPPREKCVGPNCEKAYKYRDSKSKLPLCSLGCYKAIREKMQQPLIHC